MAAKQYYGIDCQGGFYIQAVTALPGWQSSFERRIILNLADGNIYYGGSTEWIQVLSLGDGDARYVLQSALTADVENVGDARYELQANLAADVKAIGNPIYNPLLGFTPVEQGGGTEQGTNKIYLGWDTNACAIVPGNPTRLRLTVDSSDIGNLCMVQDVEAIGDPRYLLFQNIVSSGALNDGYVYQNTNGTKPLFVTVWDVPATGSNGKIEPMIGPSNPPGTIANTVVAYPSSNGTTISVAFIVPPGYYWMLNVSNIQGLTGTILQ